MLFTLNHANLSDVSTSTYPCIHTYSTYIYIHTKFLKYYLLYTQDSSNYACGFLEFIGAYPRGVDAGGLAHNIDFNLSISFYCFITSQFFLKIYASQLMSREKFIIFMKNCIANLVGRLSPSLSIKLRKTESLIRKDCCFYFRRSASCEMFELLK